MSKSGIQLQSEKGVSGCGVIGIIKESGTVFSGEAITLAICTMMRGENGFGAGLPVMGAIRASEIRGVYVE
jgi:hypothetical protein